MKAWVCVCLEGGVGGGIVFDPQLCFTTKEETDSPTEDVEWCSM